VGSDDRQAEWAPSDAARRIIVATEELLADRALEHIAVADIMGRAGVARGTFYLWFDSKYDVVVKAHRQVTSRIMEATEAFFESAGPDRVRLRAAIAGFVDIWREHGPVLAASAEIWRSQPDLRAEWELSMAPLLDRVTTALAAAPGFESEVDPALVAHALIWMNERTAYMAAADFGPTRLDDALVEALVEVWWAVIAGRGSADGSGARRE